MPAPGVNPAAAAPQWSPVVTTGTTDRLDSVHQRELPAAMEPRRDDGDDRAALQLALLDDAAAMEPRRDDGDDDGLPQLRTARRRCRNGAPS